MMLAARPQQGSGHGKLIRFLPELFLERVMCVLGSNLLGRQFMTSCVLHAHHMLSDSVLRGIRSRIKTSESRAPHFLVSSRDNNQPLLYTIL